MAQQPDRTSGDSVVAVVAPTQAGLVSVAYRSIKALHGGLVVVVVAAPVTTAWWSHGSSSLPLSW
jgi:hypothetical protein